LISLFGGWTTGLTPVYHPFRYTGLASLYHFEKAISFPFAYISRLTTSLHRKQRIFYEYKTRVRELMGAVPGLAKPQEANKKFITLCGDGCAVSISVVVANDIHNELEIVFSSLEECLSHSS